MSNQSAAQRDLVDLERSSNRSCKNPEDMNQDSQVLTYDVGMPIYSVNFSNKMTNINGHDSVLLGVGSCLPQNNIIQILSMCETTQSIDKIFEF